MSPDVFDKRALIQLRLENAKDTLRDAHILHDQGSSPKSIVNRAYYAMFYAALALLVTVDKHAVKHSGVIALFDQEFVRQNIVSKEMGQMLHRAFQSRLEGDYQDYSKIDHKKATEVLQAADQFVKSIEEKLSSRS